MQGAEKGVGMGVGVEEGKRSAVLTVRWVQM